MTTTLRTPIRSTAGRLVATLGAIAMLATGACVERSYANGGIAEPEPLPDTVGVSVMFVPVSTWARGVKIARYPNHGTPSERAARRHDVQHLMAANCGGYYRTGAEGPDAVDGIVTPPRGGQGVEPSSFSYISRFWYIQYTCATPTQAAAAK